MRLSKRILSSSVGVGGGVSIEIVVIISAVEAAVVVMGIGIVGFWGSAPFPMMSVLSVAGTSGSVATLGSFIFSV